MSRREIVLLVSRAVAVLQIIAALIDSFIHLPALVFLITQRVKLSNSFPSAHPGLAPVEWTGIISSLAQIAALLVIAALFWRCGPMIERLLLPMGSTVEEAEKRI